MKCGKKEKGLIIRPTSIVHLSDLGIVSDFRGNSSATLVLGLITLGKSHSMFTLVKLS